MKVKRIIKDDILSNKKLLELAKRVNWNEDKMLDELRKQNPKVSNSDLQAIVEAFILKNKTTKDSTTRLKSYNIKNHNTGITYKVKATSYRDAKDKYEKYIKDGNSFTYKGYVIIKSSYGWKVKIGNKIIEFATDKEAKEYIDLHKDTFSEDSLSDVISYAKELERINYRTDEKTIFRALSKGSQIAKQIETHLENTIREIKKQDLENYQHKKDVFEQKLRVAIRNIYTFYDMRFEGVISEWDNGRITGKRFGGKHQSYMSVAKNLKDKFYSILMKYNKLMKDTFSEDAKWDTLLANLGFAHNQGTGDIQIWKYRDKDRNKFEKAIEHIRRVNRKLILSASSQSSGEHKITIMKPTNDSITEDADLTGKIVKYDGMTVKVIRKLTEQEKQKRAHLNNPDAGDYYEVEATSKALGTSKFIVWEARLRDSITEDATLAQLEIKNTFLEEDDDANEVKYLGFNDDRKISFYEYGDKYFAFFDLENRVEVIEKDEVQRILKKNLIKETDQDKDELFREGDEGIATTVRSENEGGSK